MTLSAERLRQVLDYDPETGIFTRKIDTGTRWKKGDVAGSEMTNGYIQVWVDGHRYLAQRLAFLYMKGKWPKLKMDHRDTTRNNNRWGNLREATNPQNLMNTNVRSDNRSGFKGVSWDTNRAKWYASIRIGRRTFGLGRFPTIQQAVDAYNGAAKIHFGEYARQSTGPI